MFLKSNVLDVPSGSPVVFYDFDGVFNWNGTSRNQRKKLEDAPGYWKRASVYTEPPEGAVGGWRTGRGSWYSLDWSGELVHKLKELRKDTGYKWVWLTTWLYNTDKVDYSLGVESDFTALWDAYPPERRTDEELDNYRYEKKLEFVLDWQKHNPGVPFVWVDDEATRLWDASKHSVNPNLVLMPSSAHGLMLSEVAQMREFLTSL